LNIRREEPYIIPDGEFDSLVLGIVIACLSVLGGFHSLNKRVVVSLEAFGILLSSGILRVEIDTKMDAKLEIITVDSKKWRTFDRSLEGVVVSKLGERQ
jgi:hypothetical protein